MAAYTKGPRWLTDEAVGKARRQLISPNGPRPPQLLPPKPLQLQSVGGKSPLQAEQRGKFAGTAGFERGRAESPSHQAHCGPNLTPRDRAIVFGGSSPLWSGPRRKAGGGLGRPWPPWSGQAAPSVGGLRQSLLSSPFFTPECAPDGPPPSPASRRAHSRPGPAPPSAASRSRRRRGHWEA